MILLLIDLYIIGLIRVKISECLKRILLYIRVKISDCLKRICRYLERKTKTDRIFQRKHLMIRCFLWKAGLSLYQSFLQQLGLG
jgi:hypothetical protein